MDIFEMVTIKDVKEEIGEVIKLTRKNRGLNQDGLAVADKFTVKNILIL